MNLLDVKIPHCGGCTQKDGVIEFKFATSPHPFWVQQDVVKDLGGVAEAFKVVSRLLCENMMPYRPSRLRPYSNLALRLGLENQSLGHRKWQHRTRQQKGNMSFYGYGFEAENGRFQIVEFSPNGSWKPWELV